MLFNWLYLTVYLLLRFLPTVIRDLINSSFFHMRLLKVVMKFANALFALIREQEYAGDQLPARDSP